MTAILIFVVIAAIVIISVWYGTNTKNNEYDVHSHVVVQPVKEVVEEFIDDRYLKLNKPNFLSVKKQLEDIINNLEQDKSLCFRYEDFTIFSEDLNVFCEETMFLCGGNRTSKINGHASYLSQPTLVIEFLQNGERITKEQQVAFNIVQDIVRDGEYVKDPTILLQDKMVSEGWYKTEDGEYYLHRRDSFSTYFYHKHITLYEFKTWTPVKYDDYKIAQTVLGKELIMCEDPKKEHWQHFLHLEMLKKQKRQQECHKFVDRILAKQVEYNDLQLKYEMIPSAPIVDILTFKNFCDMVHEDIGFEDFEIQNYLLVKQQKH